MPATFTPRSSQAELDRKAPGFGGRPPVKNRPTGGGGDGDNGDNGFRGRTPRERLRQYRLGLSFLLAGDLVFFLALISAFFVRHSGGHIDAFGHAIPDWRPFSIPETLWGATGFLAASSISVEIGRRRLFYEMDVIEEWLGMGRPMAQRTLPWLSLTALFGIGYLLCMSATWLSLSHAGIHFSTTPDSAFFFILTGGHALHILVGLGLLAIGCLGLFRLGKVEQRQILIDCIAWFWQAMTVFGLLLFTALTFRA